MRRIVIALAVCLWICGCENPDYVEPIQVEPIQSTQYRTIDGGGTESLKVVEFDGHEYIIFDTYNGGGICHKANCKFCEK